MTLPRETLSTYYREYLVIRCDIGSPTFQSIQATRNRTHSKNSGSRILMF